MAFTYDRASGRYRDVASGRLVSERAVREALDRVADAASANLTALSGRLQSGAITLADWQRGALATIKDAHVATGLAAHGGRAAMDQSTWGFVGRRLRDEYRYVRDFSQQIANGQQALSGVAARARQYGQAARSTFEGIRARDDLLRGMDEERNVLSDAEHCAQCRSLAAQGWVPIGTLPPIGSRSCRSNDRCSITRRRTKAREAAPALRLVS